MSDLKLLVLGPPLLARQDKPLEINRRKALALVVYLAITRQRHSRDALATLLWPESDQSRARADLRRVLSDLNKVVSESWLDATGEAVALQPNANVWVDTERFRALLATCQTHGHPIDTPCPNCLAPLTEAVSLYRDDFLSGFTLPDSPTFDEWQFFQTDNLRHELANALERLVAHLSAQKDFGAALPYARRWLAIDPLLEQPQRSLIELYARTGQTPAALRQYQSYVRALEEELKLAPSEEIKELYERIRRGAFGKTPAHRIETDLSSPFKLSPPSPQMEDQVRLGTVLSAGLSDAIAPLTEFQPDALAEATSTLLQIVKPLVAKYDAPVERFIGDRVQVVFGTPQAHEDDPERAIRAALEIQDLAKKYQLRVTIGISTGQIYFGAMSGSDPREVTAIGPVVSLASRLQDKAQPGQILIAPATFRHTQRAFEFIPQTVHIAGMNEPLTCYEPAQTLPFPEKIRGIEGLQTSLIGRDDELKKLKATFDAVLDGQGHILGIVGEAGLGKSRLIAELKQRAIGTWEAGMLFLWLESRCIEWRMATSYWPFIDILQNFLYFSADDERERANSLVAVLDEMAQRGDLSETRAAEIGALLGNLLSIRFGNDWDERLKNASPEQVRHQTFLAIRDFFVTLAKQQPLVLVFDDLHWADDLSLDVMSLLIDAVASSPILLLFAYRPQQQHKDLRLANIATQKHPERYAEIRLRELTPHQSRRLVESLLSVDQLPPAIEKLVLKESWGIPFFVEEAIRSLIDSGALYRAAGQWTTRAGPDSLTVPESVQSVILSRIDRLDADAKHVLRSAAVIGRMFASQLLAQILPANIDLEKTLWTLEEASLIYRERVIPEMEYAFKHGITQETVYQTLSRRQRSELHRQVGEALEQRYRETLGEHYEQLAYHYDRSQATDKAIEYLLQAGEKSRRAYLNDEAIHYFQRALERLGELPEPQRLNWQLTALTGLGQIYHGLGNEAEAEKYLRQAIAVGQQVRVEKQTLVRLYYWLGEILHWQARYDEQVQAGETGLALLVNGQSESVEAVLMNQTIAVGHLGQEDWQRFRTLTERTASFIRNLPYSEELRPAYIHIILSLYNNKQINQVVEWLQILERLAEQHHDLRALAEVYDYKWGYRFESGDLRGSIALSKRALELYQQIGDNFHVWRRLRDTALTWLMLGDLAAAENYARRALESAQAMSNTPLEFESHLSMGLVLLCRHEWGQATQEFRQAAPSSTDAVFSWREWVATYCLGATFLAQGKKSDARIQFETAMAKFIPYTHVPLQWWFNQWQLFACLLSGLENASGNAEAFKAFCDDYKSQYASISLVPMQWQLAPSAPVKFANEIPIENSTWSWIDPQGDCSLDLKNGIKIDAANGRDLWHLNTTAPRLLHPINGDWAAQTICIANENGKPAIGGLVLWQDDANFMRLVWGNHGECEVSFEGCIDNHDIIVGRGRLPSETFQVLKTWKVWLRLEKQGEQLRALASTDGECWHSVGQSKFASMESVAIGLHAVGWIDRTICPGAHPEGTSIRFESFHVWK